jgi:hypothetical protein
MVFQGYEVMQKVVQEDAPKAMAAAQPYATRRRHFFFMEKHGKIEIEPESFQEYHGDVHGDMM